MDAHPDSTVETDAHPDSTAFMPDLFIAVICIIFNITILNMCVKSSCFYENSLEWYGNHLVNF